MSHTFQGLGNAKNNNHVTLVKSMLQADFLTKMNLKQSAGL
jgi:hypothetical protein